MAAQRLDAIRQAVEARPARRVRPAHAVVGDLDRDAAPRSRDRRTEAAVASAYLPTFASASQATK